MSRPNEILAWAIRMFGPVANDRLERAARMLEESIELAQACGLSREDVERIAARAYSRPPGNIRKELAQAGMTLEALAAQLDENLDMETEIEWKRVQLIPKEEWERRHADKVSRGTANIREGR